MELSQSRIFSNGQLVRILIPLAIEQAFTLMVGLVDGIMVSAVSEAAISGVSLVNNLVNIFLTLFAGLATGGAVVTGQFLGAKKNEQAQHSVGQLLAMVILFSSFLMVICLSFAKPILLFFFGAVEQDVMDSAVSYLQITALSFPFVAITNAGAAIFRSMGNSKISLIFSVVKNTVNIIGNALFIYGLHMGVEGVAIPTLVGRMSSALILIPLFKPGILLQIRPRDLVHLHWNTQKKILSVGLPTAFENCIFQLGRVLVLALITPFGTAQTAAYAATNNLTNISMIVELAVRLTLMTVVSQCIGANDIDQAKYYTKKLILWTYMLQLPLMCAMFLLRAQLVGLFSTLSPEASLITKQLLISYLIVATLCHPLSFAIPFSLRAMNDGIYCMIVSIGSMFAARLALAWLMCTHLGWGVYGVWIGMFADWLVRSICFCARYLSGGWKKHCRIVSS